VSYSLPLPTVTRLTAGGLALTQRSNYQRGSLLILSYLVLLGGFVFAPNVSLRILQLKSAVLLTGEIASRVATRATIQNSAPTAFSPRAYPPLTATWAL
jgi:hypothetical protein